LFTCRWNLIGGEARGKAKVQELSHKSFEVEIGKEVRE